MYMGQIAKLASSTATQISRCTCTVHVYSTCLNMFPELVLIGHGIAGSFLSFCGVVHALGNDYNYGLCLCT